MDLFTLIHVFVSLAGIATGLVVLGGWLAGATLPLWTRLFLIFTLLTNITGFFFPFHGVTPGIVIGILSLVLLAVAIYALAIARLAGAWRRTYVITALTALYFNFFVLIAQLFLHTPALRALAPTQSEAPFAITQSIVLVLFIVFGVSAVKNYKAARP
jgi:hypothetical protein